MRIGGISGGSTARFEARRAPGGVPERDTTRALVVVEPAPSTDAQRFTTRRPVDAALVAQLLATRDGLPQTRARRRATSAEALAAYAAGPYRTSLGSTRAIA